MSAASLRSLRPMAAAALATLGSPITTKRETKFPSEAYPPAPAGSFTYVTRPVAWKRR
jgi:hypothetical protein